MKQRNINSTNGAINQTYDFRDARAQFVAECHHIVILGVQVDHFAVSAKAQTAELRETVHLFIFILIGTTGHKQC